MRKKKRIRKELHHLRILAGHLFRFRYPKLAVLVLSIIISYFVFSNDLVADKLSILGEMGYFGIFLAGIFYSFGFSSPFVVGFLLSVENLNIFLAAFIGGIGSLLADLFIFSVIKFSFVDEFNELKKTKPFRFVEKIMEKDLNSRARRFLLYLMAIFFIASPMPDEIGVTIVSGLTNIGPRILGAISFILNSLGILIILLIGNVV